MPKPRHQFFGVPAPTPQEAAVRTLASYIAATFKQSEREHEGVAGAERELARARREEHDVRQEISRTFDPEEANVIFREALLFSENLLPPTIERPQGRKTWERARERVECHNCGGRRVERSGEGCMWCNGSGWEWRSTDEPNTVLKQAMEASPLGVRRGLVEPAPDDDNEDS